MRTVARRQTYANHDRHRRMLAALLVTTKATPTVAIVAALLLTISPQFTRETGSREVFAHPTQVSFAVGEEVALRARVNNRFVTAESGGQAALIANRTEVALWEEFEISEVSGNDVSIRARVNGRFVTAENAGSAPLIANRAAALSWETFEVISNQDGTYSFRSRANGLIVTAESAGAAPLIANRSAIDTWEKFDIVQVSTPESASSGFPNASNTGVPAGTNLTSYTGPCTIQTAGTTIDSKTVNCDLDIQAANVTVRNSKVNGLIVVDTDRSGGPGWSVTVQDSEVYGGQQQRATISNGNLTVIRSNVHGGITGVQCDEHSVKCLVQDSWIHGQYFQPGSDWHIGGILSNGTTNITISHNTVACDATDGCTGDINFIPNFAPISGALVENNLLKANPNAAYCTYGGEKSTSPYPHSDHIVYRNNVFERGTNSKCAAYGPVTSFNSSGNGNIWQNNTWDDGTTVNPAN